MSKGGSLQDLSTLTEGGIMTQVIKFAAKASCPIDVTDGGNTTEDIRS